MKISSVSSRLRAGRKVGFVSLLTSVAWVGLILPSASAATAVSRIFGAVPVVAQGGSDTALSIPMKAPAVLRGAVASLNNGVVLAGTPNLTASQFSPGQGTPPQTFYLFFESGDLAGRYFRITGNTVSTISVFDGNGELVQAEAGDTVAVHPYWTLATLFPAAEGLPTAVKAGERPIELIVPAVQASGINPSAEDIFYLRDGAWRRVGSPFEESFDDRMLEPDHPIIVRVNQEEDVTLVMTGEVVMSELAIAVRSRADGPQDTLIGLNRPLAQTLDELGLGGSDAFETTTDPGAIRDRLILYSADPGQNKVPVEAFYYYNGAWRREGGSAATDEGATVIPAGRGFVIRTAGQGIDGESYWTQTFNP